MATTPPRPPAKTVTPKETPTPKDTRPTPESLATAVLEILNTQPQAHRFNLLGKPGEPGEIERHIAGTFKDEERRMANEAIQTLITDLKIQPTLRDVVDPANWLEITDLGRESLAPPPVHTDVPHTDEPVHRR